MGDIIKSWLRTRLGIIVDLSPEIFGHYSRDGTLVAKLLHSYDIINDSQLNTIIRTQDAALCRVNLKHLRVWLRFIGVDLNDESLEEISNGRGTTAVRLFYKIFLSLENKDRLHFITQQKEREKYIPTSTKFEVIKVSEEEPPAEPVDHPLSKPLIENASLIEWHRNKFQAIIDGCKRERERFREKQSQQQRTLSGANILAAESMTKRRQNIENAEKAEADEFERKHRVTESKGSARNDLCKERKSENMEPHLVDPEAAKMYVKRIRNRIKRATATNNLKSHMQKMLMSELWERLLRKQEDEFDEMIARKVMSQSQYEKMMITKLCEVRSQRERIARNRQIVEELMNKTKENEGRSEEMRRREEILQEAEEVEVECRRMCELRDRLREEKERRLRERHYRLCAEALNDLVDISIRAVDYRSSNRNCIPIKVWSEWKSLFLKGQPIFDLLEHIEDIADEELNEKEEEEGVEEIFRAEVERQEILNEADFEAYLNLEPPWDEFVPERSESTEEILRLGATVLGYIVHSLLEYMYPHPPNPAKAPVPEVSSAAIVLGVLDVKLYPILQELLDNRSIRLIRMENAINYCLLSYKEEMKDSEYINLSVTAATKEMPVKDERSQETVSLKKSRKKDKELDKPTTTQSALPSATSAVEKQTQTPRVIPHDDLSPELSDAAYVGKWAHEFLALGQPISENLNAKILIEYLKSLTDISGWALIDYPTTYEQMVHLESALTGQRIPPLKENAVKDEVNIENVDPIPSRITFDDEEEREQLKMFEKYRNSRLLPNPLPERNTCVSTSFMTAYIRAIPKPKHLEDDEMELFEVLPEDATPLDIYYAEQGLAYALYYTTFDLSTLKRLARIIIGDTSIPRTSSSELFGDIVNVLEGKKEETGRRKIAVVRRFVRRSENGENDSALSSNGDKEGEGEGILSESSSQYLVEEAKLLSPQPGEDGWLWTNFSLPPIFLEALATLWQNLESVYIQNVKQIFFNKRIQYFSVIPYRNHVTRHMMEYINRPDNKQDALHEFHRAFNDLAKDLRQDDEVKCELHCRVADFQSGLWEICDRRRREAEEERRRIILDNWTSEEIVILVNLYISLIQTEVDRCIDTFQLILDYYTLMLQRPLFETRLSKILLNRLLEVDKPEQHTNPSVTKEKETKDMKEMKKKNLNTRTASAPIIDCSQIKAEVANILTTCEKQSSAAAESTWCKAIRANIQYAQAVVDSISSSTLDQLKKEEAAITSKTEGTKGKTSSRKSVAPDSEQVQKIANLYKEWNCAFVFEYNRIRERLDVLDSAACADMTSLLETMENAFHEVHRDLIDRYNREIKSVNEMASVFCFAIEEAIPIQEEMLLDGDRFLVRSSVLMYPNEPPEPEPPVEEDVRPSRFQIAQLGRLMDIFRHAAPSGSLPERSFVYILQDLVSCGEEQGGVAPLPANWMELRPCEITRLISLLFGDVEYIDWREFLIYALDIPAPSVRQILDARMQFRLLDRELGEVVSRDQFHSIRLWFLNYVEPLTECERLLHEDFQRDDEELYDVEREIRVQDKIEKWEFKFSEKLIMQSVYSDGSLADENDRTFSVDSDKLAPSEILRLMLGKELLCEMFLVSSCTVNYTALLLAFCKGNDPREGLGKALSLATGSRVCTDVTEGEIYVEELFEQKRLESQRDHLREQALMITSSIIKHMLEEVVQQTEGFRLKELLQESQSDTEDIIYAGPIKIQKLDEPGEIDPAELLMQAEQSPPVAPTSIDPNEESIASSEFSVSQDGEASNMNVTTEEEPVVAYWIPLNICQAVLTACLPWHARQPNLLEASENISKGLVRVYSELRVEELAHDENVVLSHRLVNHNFITSLVASTSKFTTKRMENLLNKVLRERNM